MRDVGGPIYLDHHATTPCSPKVLEVMLPYFSEIYGNPSSSDHLYGQRAGNAVENAREQVAKLIRSRPEEIIFTSGATESDNLALFGSTALAPEGKRHIISTQVEHKAALEPLNRLEKRGWRVTYLPVDQRGNIDIGELEREIKDDTFLISIMAANNEVGTIYPLEAIGKIAKNHGVLFHTDAAQAVGNIPVSVQDMGIDLLSCSAHKMYGPKGVGALFVRRRDPKVKLEPQQLGGGHERGMRSGTPPVPLIVGFGAAASESKPGREVRKNRDFLWKKLNELSTVDLYLNGPELTDNRLPNNLNFSAPPMDSYSILKLIASKFAVSPGSACTDDKVAASHVLEAMGVGEERTNSAIRVGIGRGNTQDDLEGFAQEYSRIAKRIRLLA